LVHPQHYRTPKKSRILSGGENTKKQQVLRIDTLNKSGVDPGAYDAIESILCGLLEGIEMVILSDYIFESAVPHLLTNIRERFPSRQVIIDSRRHLTKFHDITIATPNEPEVRNIFPGRSFREENDFFEAGRELLERLKAQGLILKRGHKGMVVLDRDGRQETVDIHGSTDIVDVTGAGDTVISLISLALSAGADLFEAARLANIAAGFVVMKEGAYPIGIEELENELK
ncbi:MAG: hypothetical protein GY940_02145, partial [bacterium]|nr:hypothetical protein [bacterium]